MNKKTWYWIILIVIVGAAAWYGWTSGFGHTTRLDADVYPLYSGVTWGKATATTSPGLGQISEVQALAASGTMDIASVTQPFTKYYSQKLEAAGWTADPAMDAGAPGAEISVYEKDKQFIEVAYGSFFHNISADAPEQCPCDVTFTLASGTLGSQ